MEAAVILAKCPKNRQMYGMRTQKMSDGDWWRTWAFPINESRAHQEGYDMVRIHGNLYAMDEYPGCPYCGTKSFVRCDNCGKLTCWNNESILDCLWCGNRMNNIMLATERFHLYGGDV